MSLRRETTDVTQDLGEQWRTVENPHVGSVPN